jgi:outer membrane lipoprotein carrier protein
LASCRQTECGTSSSRRRHQTTSLLLACGLLVAFPVWSQADTASEAWPPVLTRFLAEVRTFSANFEQEIWTEDLELLEDVAMGTVQLRRPNRFLLKYTSPYEQIIVANGAVLWIYDADIRQATRAKIDEETAASPAMLLSGDESVLETFRLIDESERDGVDWLTLTPLVDNSEFETVRLGFESDELTQLEFVNALEQTTVIRFSAIKTNLTLPDELFEFKPPRGAHVLGDVD